MFFSWQFYREIMIFIPSMAKRRNRVLHCFYRFVRSKIECKDLEEADNCLTDVYMMRPSDTSLNIS